MSSKDKRMTKPSELAEEISKSLWNLWLSDDRDPDVNQEDGATLIDQKLSGVREALRQLEKSQYTALVKIWQSIKTEE